MTSKPDDRQTEYDVEESEGKFDVTDRSGRVHLVCSDAGSAGHYAVLMNAAFERGFKKGFSEAKRT